MAPRQEERRDAPVPDANGPKRGRGFERVAIGALLGTAVFLGVGQVIEATGGT